MTAEDSTLIPESDPLAQQARSAIHGGDVAGLARLLAGHHGLATTHIKGRNGSRSLLHLATDWPGHFPNVASTIALLVAAGACVDARTDGSTGETPLHWAASSDDVAAADALLDAGADIEIQGAVLSGGSPLADACGFGQWNVARRLVERGAELRLQDAASLGLMDRVEAFFAGVVPDHEAVTIALWYAANAGRREAADFLIARGANINWVGYDDATPLDLALGNEDTAFADWLRDRGAKTTAEVSSG